MVDESRRNAVAAAGLGLLLAACHSAPPAPPAAVAPPPKPIDVRISVVAAADLNPNRGGRASPVYLRVYQLRDSSKFDNAEFDDLTLRTEATLAGTLLGREERMVQPATTADLAMKIDPDTQLLGVVADYSDLAASRWRGRSPAVTGGLLQLFKDQSLLIKLDRQAVSVAATGGGS
jgi:type VI secretion system protein VasD